MTMRGRPGPYATKLRLMPVTDQAACTARSFDVPSVASICLIKSPTHQHRLMGPLDLRLRALADPRHRRGKRHSFVSVLLIACSAVLTGHPRRDGLRCADRTECGDHPPGAECRLSQWSGRPARIRSGRGRDPHSGRQERPRLAPRRYPGCPSAGRGHRRRPDRHPAAGSWKCYAGAAGQRRCCGTGRSTCRAVILRSDVRAERIRPHRLLALVTLEEPHPRAMAPPRVWGGAIIFG